MWENAVRYTQSRIFCTCRLNDGILELEITNDYVPSTMPPPCLHHASAGLGLRLVRGICKASAFQLDLATTPNYFQVRVRFPQR